MNVLHLLNDFNRSSSGINEVVATLVAGLRRAGIDVAVCSSGGDRIREAEELGIPHYTLPLAGWSSHPMQYFTARKGLRRLIREHGFDLLHAHSGAANMAAHSAACRGSPPVVSSLHMSVGVGFWARRIRRRGACVIAHSEFLLDQHRVPASRRRLIRNCVCTDRFDPDSIHRGRFREEFNIPSDAFVVTNFGGSASYKGMRFFVDALGHIPSESKVHFVLAGGYPREMDDLRRRAETQAGEQRVTVPGQREDIPQIMADSDILVVSSTQDSIPMALIEGWTMGLPVVATLVGGIPEVARHEENALLVPPGDAQAVAAAVQRLADDERLRRTLGAEARRTAAALHPDRIAAETIQVYEEILGDPCTSVAGEKP